MERNIILHDPLINKLFEKEIMNDKIQKLEDLIELYKSNSITKEEYDLLKTELLIDSNSKEENTNSISTKPKVKNNYEDLNYQEDTFYESNKGIINPILVIVIIGLFLFNIINKKNNHDESVVEEVITSTNNSVNNSAEPASNICIICGREFTGSGYEEVSNGVWKPLEEPYSNQICSPTCGRKSNQNLIDVARKYGVDLEESETNSSNQGEYKTGNDGRVYEQNKCQLCKGTGIEKGNNVATGENEDRICPMCDGRGVRSY